VLELDRTYRSTLKGKGSTAYPLTSSTEYIRARVLMCAPYRFIPALALLVKAKL
jgi:hypothetical protein